MQRIGNLTPLEYTLNKGLGAADYERKHAVYLRSSYRLTQSLAAAEWSPASVRARQLQMAERAALIWRIELEDGERPPRPQRPASAS